MFVPLERKRKREKGRERELEVVLVLHMYEPGFHHRFMSPPTLFPKEREREREREREGGGLFPARKMNRYVILLARVRVCLVRTVIFFLYERKICYCYYCYRTKKKTVYLGPAIKTSLIDVVIVYRGFRFQK